MNEKQRRARTILVEAGLRRVLQGAVSRSEFFTPDVPPSFAKDRDALYAEMAKKSWQRGVLDRLIRYGGLGEAFLNDAQVYVAKDPDKIRGILQDHDDHGVALAWFVFPKEVPEGAPDELRSLSEEPTEENEEQEPDGAAPARPDKQVTVSESTLLAMLDALSLLNVALDRANRQSQEQAQQESKERDSLRHEVHKVAKRLSDVEAAVSTTHQLLTTTHTMVKNHMNNVLEIEKSAQSMRDTVAEVTHVRSDLQALTQSLDAFVGEYRAAKTNSLHKISQQLEQHINAGKALHDEVLEVVANEANHTG